MARFRNRQTGREIAVHSTQVDRFARSRRWEPLDEIQFDPVGDVPDGTVQEILAWANDDPDRRQAALYAERQGKGRKTLIDALSD
jgi:hypothetical protein